MSLPHDSSDSDQEYINRTIGASIPPLSKKSALNFINTLESGPVAGNSSAQNGFSSQNLGNQGGFSKNSFQQNWNLHNTNKTNAKSLIHLRMFLFWPFIFLNSIFAQLKAN